MHHPGHHQVQRQQHHSNLRQSLSQDYDIDAVMQDEQSLNRNLDGSGAFSDQRVSACDNKKIPSDYYDFQAHYGRT